MTRYLDADQHYWFLVFALLVALLLSHAAGAQTLLTSGVPPFISDRGSAMVPMRSVFEWMGATLRWDGAEKVVEATRNSGDERRVVRLQIGAETAMVDGRRVRVRQAPVLQGGRTFVPLRLVSEALGVAVDWDAKQRRVTLIDGERRAYLDVPPDIRAPAAAVVRALQQGNLVELTPWVHPDRGVRFSPYGHVDTDTDRVLSAAELRRAGNDKTVYRWGHYEGEGGPIDLTFEEYLHRFVASRDFAAGQVSYNIVHNRGTMINNVREAYPGAAFVEYHVPGRDPRYGGMDWQSLRLVFVPYEGQPKLVGVIHDEWTP